MKNIQVLPISNAHKDWVRQTLRARWGSVQIVSRGRVHLADRLPGFIALQQHQPVGLVTYHLESGQCEITSLDSLSPGVGIGSALIAAVKQVAEIASCQRLWLITTNDNIPAIRFYQKRGFHLVAVHPDALEISRQRKPGIPKTGFEGIPLRDELEFEMALNV